MVSYADVKAKTLNLTTSLTVNDGINSLLVTPTTISGTFLNLSNANLSGNTKIETLNIENIALTGTPPFSYLPTKSFNQFFGATDTGWVYTNNVPNNSNFVFSGTNGLTVPGSYFVNWWVSKPDVTTYCRMRIVGTAVTQTNGTTLTGGAPFENAGLIFANTMTGATDFSGMGFFQGVTPYPNIWMTIENRSSYTISYTTRMLIFRVA